MPVLKSILVPVDFCTVAENAFDFALRLADKYPARIDLLHCLPTALSSPGMARILVDRGRELEEEAIEKMAEFRRKGMDGAINELTGIPEVYHLSPDFFGAYDYNLTLENFHYMHKAEVKRFGFGGPKSSKEVFYFFTTEHTDHLTGPRVLRQEDICELLIID